MKMIISQALLNAIQQHGVDSYPEEGAGVLLGEVLSTARQAVEILTQTNQFDASSRHNRYLIDARDILKAEQKAEELGLEVIGVFHSHPDHAAEPSAYDLQWGLPWYSYLITHVERDRAVETRSWRLNEDRQGFSLETLEITRSNPIEELS
jgi:proteasome lid subunit RPN8/RPN11